MCVGNTNLLYIYAYNNKLIINIEYQYIKYIIYNMNNTNNTIPSTNTNKDDMGELF